MVETGKDKRYLELLAKDRKGTLTEEEYDEMLQLEQEAIEEECLRMAHLGI